MTPEDKETASSGARCETGMSSRISAAPAKFPFISGTMKRTVPGNAVFDRSNNFPGVSRAE